MNFVESERINRLHSRMLTDKVCCYFKLNPYVVALAQAKSPIKGSPKLFSQIVMSVFTPFLLRSFTTHSSNSVCNENMQFDYGLLLSYLRIEVMFKKMLINKILATFQTIKTKYYPFPPHFSEWHNSPLIWSQPAFSAMDPTETLLGFAGHIQHICPLPHILVLLFHHFLKCKKHF